LDRLYYLSVPPSVYPKAVEQLGAHGLARSCRHDKAQVRILIEKPFGYDLKSAESLLNHTQKHFDESQIFRIDHYLAKESSQNIVTFRRHNPVFMDSWDGRHISRIQVIAHEDIGVEGRGDFYNQVGALRDLVQSHLMQLLALVMVETGRSDDDIALHKAKRDVLDSLSPPDVTTTMRGQYAGYAAEIGQPHSRTETYVRLQLASSLPKWQGTDIVLETGKALRSKKTEIRLSFTDEGTPGNELTFRIQPNEGIDLQLTVKKPGFSRQLQKVSMDFSYRGAFAEPEHPEAYERVLVDAIRGDHHLFATNDEVLASWRALQPILDYWKTHDDFVVYEPGSDGPEETAKPTGSGE
jgi:glucose-6-phosphate 1-dehydrogenase